MARTVGSRGIAASLWILLFCFYGVIGTGHSSLSDGYLLFLTARNLLVEADPSIPPVFLGGEKLGRDGKYYCKYGPGLAIAHVPMLLAARALPILEPRVDGGGVDPLERDEFFAELTNAWLMATAVMLVFLSGMRLGFTARQSAAVAAVAAWASPLWLYARIDSTEALQATSLAASFYFLLGWRNGARVADLSLGGATLGVALLAKPANLLVAPWFAAYALAAEPARGRRGAAALGFFAPVALAVALIAFYNHFRFGSLLDTGFDFQKETFSQPLVRGMVKMLVSPSYGMIVFWPASLLVWLGAKPFFERFRREAALIVCVGLTLWMLYARWWAYWGVHWGPRLLVPVIPLAALFLLPAAAGVRSWSRAALLAAALCGFGVQIVATGASYWTQVLLVHRSVAAEAPGVLVNDPRVAPLRVALWLSRLAVARGLVGENGAEERMQDPPWREAYPWKPGAVDQLRPFVGLDLWALPGAWRLPRYTRIWPGEPAYPIPSSGTLRASFLGGMMLASISLGALLLRSRRENGRAMLLPSRRV